MVYYFETPLSGFFEHNIEIQLHDSYIDDYEASLSFLSRVLDLIASNPSQLEFDGENYYVSSIEGDGYSLEDVNIQYCEGRLLSLFCQLNEGADQTDLFFWFSYNPVELKLPL